MKKLIMFFMVMLIGFILAGITKIYANTSIPIERLEELASNNDFKSVDLTEKLVVIPNNKNTDNVNLLINSINKGKVVLQVSFNGEKVNDITERATVKDAYAIFYFLDNKGTFTIFSETSADNLSIPDIAKSINQSYVLYVMPPISAYDPSIDPIHDGNPNPGYGGGGSNSGNDDSTEPNPTNPRTQRNDFDNTIINLTEKRISGKYSYYVFTYRLYFSEIMTDHYVYKVDSSTQFISGYGSQDYNSFNRYYYSHHASTKYVIEKANYDRYGQEFHSVQPNLLDYWPKNQVRNLVVKSGFNVNLEIGRKKGISARSIEYTFNSSFGFGYQYEETTNIKAPMLNAVQLSNQLGVKWNYDNFSSTYYSDNATNTNSGVLIESKKNPETLDVFGKISIYTEFVTRRKKPVWFGYWYDTNSNHVSFHLRNS